MNDPLLLDIVTFLVNNGIAIGDGIDCFRDFSPEEPDDAIILQEYASAPPTSYEGNDIVDRSVQITVRSKDADSARQRALRIYNLLDVKDNARRIDFTSERFAQVFIKQLPFKIFSDENHRTIYGFNIGVATTIH